MGTVVGFTARFWMTNSQISQADRKWIKALVADWGGAIDLRAHPEGLDPLVRKKTDQAAREMAATLPEPVEIGEPVSMAYLEEEDRFAMTVLYEMELSRDYGLGEVDKLLPQQ